MQEQAGLNFFQIFFFCLLDLSNKCIFLLQELPHVDISTSFGPMGEQRMEFGFTIFVLLGCDLIFTDNVLIPLLSFDLAIISEV